jgi:hypothetical protein
MADLLLWPVPAIVAALVAAAAFWAGRLMGPRAIPPAPPADPHPRASAVGDGWGDAAIPGDHPVRAEMGGLMRLLARAGGQTVVLETAARVLESSRVRVEEAADVLAHLGLIVVHSPLRRPNYVELTEAGRRHLERDASAPD